MEHNYKFSLDKPPADTTTKKSLRNQIGLGRYDGFLRYNVKIKSFYTLHDTWCGQKLQNDIKSGIDDVINTSKIPDIPQNVFNNSYVSRWSYIQSFNSIQSVWLTVTNMHEKHLRIHGRVAHTHTHILWGTRETTFYSSEKRRILRKNACDNFDKTCKKSFSYPEERSQKSKKFVNLSVL